MQVRTNRADVVMRAARVALFAGGAASLYAPAVLAAPQGQQVVRGQAQFSRVGDTTVIRASNGAIINYGSFDIAAHEAVRFVQPGAEARVLNRIQSAAPTRIDGALQANGRVYIVNPAGVIFGRGSIIDVAGLYAGAAHIADSDFARGVNHFTDVAGAVVNEGTINASAVHLIGAHVANHGAIVANKGIVSMLVGNDVYIGEQGGSIYVRIDGASLSPEAGPAKGAGATPDLAAAPGVENTGSISARGGRITLGAGDAYSLAIRNSGSIRAAGGNVALAARDGAIHNSGELSASASRGKAGDVTVQAPVVLHEGIASADTGAGQAGRVEITSSRGTTLASGSVVSAAGGKGNAHGGEVLVHAYEGDTVFAPGATVDISGGDLGGHGGFAEISGGERLAIHGRIKGDVKAGFDAATVLFDPRDILIFGGAPGDGADDGEVGDGLVGSGDGGMLDFSISTGAIEAFVGDVILEAERDIIAGETINKTNGGLIFDAGRDILMGGEFGGGDTASFTATFLEFTAGRNIIDRSLLGTNLTSTSGNITLEATTGHIEFALATVPFNRTLSLTQAENLFVGAGPFGYVGNPAGTNLNVTVTNGWLIFGGEFGGEIGFTQQLRSVDAFASNFVRVDDNLDVTGNARIRSLGNVEVNGFIHSDSGAITLHGDTNGNGSGAPDVFFGPGADLAAESINLLAGSNSGQATARVDARTNNPALRGASLGATRPTSVRFEQDAPITAGDLPSPGQFGAALAGMEYRVESYDASVTIGNGSIVEGTQLTLASQTGSVIDDDLDLASLRVINTATLNEDVTSTGDQTYEGDVTLGADVILTGDDIVFEQELDGAAAATIAADVVFGGFVGGATPLQTLAVMGAASIDGGGVTTQSGQNYSGPLALGDHTALTSLDAGVIRLGGGANGPFDLFVTTSPGGLIILGDSLGASQALRDIRLSTAGESGVRPIPDRATIVGEQSLSIHSRDFVMGQHEKFTTLGSLNVNASRLAELSDLVTTGAMTVTAPEISLLRREGASLLNSAGVLVTDRGLDFVAGGAINFNGAITLAGDAAAHPPTFGSAASDVAPPSLEDFEFSLIDGALVTESALMFDGIVLDQRTSPGDTEPPGPPDDETDPSPDLAGADRTTPQFQDFTLPEAYDVQLLGRIAVASRAPSLGEAQGATVGRALFNDMPAAPAGFTEGERIASATRFDIDLVRRVVEAYEGFFGPGEGSGDAPQIAVILSAASQQYMSLHDAAQIDAAGFDQFLRENPDQAVALDYVLRLRAVLREMQGLGLTPAEYAQARDRLLATLARVEGLTVEQLRLMADPTLIPGA